MIDYRDILRLHSQNQSQRRIEANVHSSHQTVNAVLEKATKYGISWPLDDEMTNEKLNEILSISAKENEVITYAEPDYAYIHRELSKKGVTLTLLWSECCERCYANGEKPYMSTQFGDKYRNWARITKATMCINHKPSETMQVD